MQNDNKENTSLEQCKCILFHHSALEKYSPILGELKNELQLNDLTRIEGDSLLVPQTSRPQQKLQKQYQMANQEIAKLQLEADVREKRLAKLVQENEQLQNCQSSLEKEISSLKYCNTKLQEEITSTLTSSQGTTSSSSNTATIVKTKEISQSIANQQCKRCKDLSKTMLFVNQIIKEIKLTIENIQPFFKCKSSQMLPTLQSQLDQILQKINKKISVAYDKNTHWNEYIRITEEGLKQLKKELKLGFKDLDNQQRFKSDSQSQEVHQLKSDIEKWRCKEEKARARIPKFKDQVVKMREYLDYAKSKLIGLDKENISLNSKLSEQQNLIRSLRNENETLRKVKSNQQQLYEQTYTNTSQVSEQSYSRERVPSRGRQQIEKSSPEIQVPLSQEPSFLDTSYRNQSVLEDQLLNLESENEIQNQQVKHLETTVQAQFNVINKLNGLVREQESQRVRSEVKSAIKEAKEEYSRRQSTSPATSQVQRNTPLVPQLSLKDKFQSEMQRCPSINGHSSSQISFTSGGIIESARTDGTNDDDVLQTLLTNTTNPSAKQSISTSPQTKIVQIPYEVKNHQQQQHQIQQYRQNEVVESFSCESDISKVQMIPNSNTSTSQYEESKQPLQQQQNGAASLRDLLELNDSSSTTNFQRVNSQSQLRTPKVELSSKLISKRQGRSGMIQTLQRSASFASCSGLPPRPRGYRLDQSVSSDISDKGNKSNIINEIKNLDEDILSLQSQLMKALNQQSVPTKQQ